VAVDIVTGNAEGNQAFDLGLWQVQPGTTSTKEWWWAVDGSLKRGVRQ